MRINIILFVALCFLVMGAGCTTSLLYNRGSPTTKPKITEEEISTFLITEDGKQLIVVGKQYHYIFDLDVTLSRPVRRPPNATLKFILNWSEKKLVAASFGTFNVDTQQNIVGRYHLAIDPNAISEQAREKLLANGFRYNDDKPIRLSYNGTLMGKRYSSNNFTLPKAVQFNQKYKITVEEQISSSGALTTVENILLTPLTLAADGVLLCAGVPALFLSPFLELFIPHH